MSENFNIPISTDKKERYEVLLPQIKALVEGENDLIANISNIMSALKYGMNFFWVGCYFVKSHSGKEELVLGSFQGPVACTRIAKGKGVCGKSWEQKKIIIVDDVEKFPGHIACSSESKSEIVLPAYDKNGSVFLVLDVDSNLFHTLKDVDKKQFLHLYSILLLCIHCKLTFYNFSCITTML